jgi:hypothetical protein
MAASGFCTPCSKESVKASTEHPAAAKAGRIDVHVADHADPEAGRAQPVQCHGHVVGEHVAARIGLDRVDGGDQVSSRPSPRSTRW